MKKSEHQDSEVRMSLGDHLEELRRRLIYALIGVAVGLVAGFVFAKPVILAMEVPFHRAMEDLGKPAERLAVLSAGAGFDIYMKASIWCAVILASPWIIYQLWAFVSAGLLPREKRMVYFAIPFFVVLFLGGAAFFNFLVAVPALKFLLYFDDKVFDLNIVITLQSQVSFMAEMMIVFGLAFQTPLVILVLAKIGLVSMRTLRDYRRHAIVIILAFAAVFAPGDVVSMIALAVPMWLLYELGVLLAYFLAFKKTPAEDKAQS